MNKGLRKGLIFLSKRGICSVTFRDKSAEEIIKLAKDADLQAIEWAGDAHVPISNKEHAERIGKLTRDAGLDVSSYGSYFYAGSGDPFEPYIETTRALGTNAIRVWAKKMDFKKEVNKINEDEFAVVVKDLKLAAKKAHAFDISLHIEWHQGTYTDSTESALRLLNEIDEGNVFLYWQPLAYLSPNECLKQIKDLGDAISNVHVFHWDEERKRHPLADGTDEWQAYINQVETHSSTDHYYLMEFVKDNADAQFAEDLEIFKGFRI